MSGFAHYAALGVIGAVIAMSLAYLARLNLYFMMGLVPLFPAFALMAHTMLATGGNVAGLRMAAAFGLYALIPYATYLTSIVVLSHVMPPIASVAIGLLGWFATATVLVMAWNAGLLPGRL
jgi:membrane protein GlpM